MRVCGEAAKIVTAGKWKCATNGCHAVLDNFPLLIHPMGGELQQRGLGHFLHTAERGFKHFLKLKN